MAERALLRPFFFDQTFGVDETKEFIFPMVHYRTLSLVISSRDDASAPLADNLTVNVLLEVNKFFVAHPIATGGVVERNILFFFTNEDIHGEMKVEIISGTVPPSDGVDVSLWAWR